MAFVALGHEKPCDALQQGFFVAFFIRAKDCAYKQKNAQKDVCVRLTHIDSQMQMTAIGGHVFLSPGFPVMRQ